MARNRVIDTGAMRDIHFHVEALDSLARARVFPGVDDSAAKAVHKLLVDDLNDALRAALAPPPVARDGETAFRERPEAPAASPLAEPAPAPVDTTVATAPSTAA